METGGTDAQTGYNDQVAASSHIACFFAVRCPAEGRRGVPLSAEKGQMVLHLSRVNDLIETPGRCNGWSRSTLRQTYNLESHACCCLWTYRKRR